MNYHRFGLLTKQDSINLYHLQQELAMLAEKRFVSCTFNFSISIDKALDRKNMNET